MERREKMDQLPQKPRLDLVQRKWTRREEADFLRTIWNFGVLYDPEKQTYEWTKFKLLSKLDKKIDEAMTEYYKSFMNMCRKQCGLKIEEESEVACEVIDSEKAKRTLERVELLSKIREETLSHPQLDERLELCQPSADVPDWWICGKHDRDLLIGVAKHGLGRSDYHILNDPELSFHEILYKQYSALSSTLETKAPVKLENPEDILKFHNKNEITFKLEKGEGTLKIEKIVKKETAEIEKETEVEKEIKEDIKKPDEKEEVESKDEDSEAKTEETKDEEPKVDKIEKEQEKMDEDIEDTKEKDTDSVSKESEKAVDDEEPASTEEKVETASETSKKVEDDSASEKSLPQAKPVDIEKKEETKDSKSDDVSKQAAELKAMFPDLEVIQPLSRLSQIDTYVLREKPGSGGALDFTETTVAQMFNNAIKWPKEYALQTRLQHIVHLVDHGEWPATLSFSAYSNIKNIDLDIAVYDTPNLTPKRDTSTPMSNSEESVITITTDHGLTATKIKSDPIQSNSNSRKRKRHIAIDVETERAKLHALLNSSAALGAAQSNNSHSSQIQATSLIKPSTSLNWGDNDDSEESRRSTPVTQPALQPPPAHQQASRILSMPFDLKYQPGKINTPLSVNITPASSSSSSMGPMDLSSG